MVTLRPSLVRVALGAAIAVALAAGCGRDDPQTLLSKARAAISANDARTAEIHLKNVLRDRPDDPEARVLLAGVYASLPDPRSAEKEWLRALELGMAPDRALPGLLEARVTVGDAKGAIDAATRWKAESPQAVADVGYWRGRAHEALGDAKAADRAYRDALAARSDDYRSAVALLAMQAAAGDARGAEASVDELLARQPGQYDALVLKADLQVRRGDATGARDGLLKAIEAEPRRPQARLRLLSLLIEQKDYDAARAQHAELRKIAPGLVMTRFLGALLDFRTDRLEAARDALQGLLGAQPDFLPGVALAANVALAQGALEQAETHARKILDRAPQSMQGAKLLATVHLRRNDPERALQVARPLLDKGVEDASLLAIAGEAALRGNDAQAATRYFERAAKLDPQDPAKRAGLGVAQLSAGRFDAGIAALTEAAAQDPKSTLADMALISARMRSGQHREALEAIERLEAKQPDKGLPSNLRGTVRLALGEIEAARGDFERALKLEPDFFPALANLAALDVRQGKPEAATDRLRAFVKQNPRNTQAPIALAQHLARTKAPAEDVAGVLQAAHVANPRAPELAAALGRAWIESNKASTAIPMLQQALAQAPSDPTLLETLATAHQRAGESQQAVDVFDRLLRLQPNSAARHLRMAEFKASLGDSVGAAASIRQAIALDKNVAQAQIGIAASLLRAGKKEEARRLAAALTREVPDNPAGWILEGDIQAAERNWRDAAIAYRRALTIQRSTSVVVKLHQSLLRAERAPEAESILRDALRAAPDDVALRMYAGESALATRQWKVAVEHYEAVVKASPNNAVALNNLAWSLHELGDPRALRVAGEAYKRAPGVAQVVDTLGVILVSRGDAKLGLQKLKEAMALAPTVPQYRLHYASALARTGDKVAAKAALEEVERTHAGTPYANEARRIASTL